MIKKVAVREVRVKDADLLATMIEDREYSLRALSEEVRRELRKKRKPTIGTSKSTLGNLTTGEQATVREDVAKAIAAVLRVKKWQALFADDVYTVAREAGPRRAA